MVNVYEAAVNRIAYIFDHFDHISVSFSGGKDSGILLRLVIDHAISRDQCTKVSVFHLDYEAQYQSTTDFVQETLNDLREKNIMIHHWCVPVKAKCSTSMYQSWWRPWNPVEKHLWARDMPNNVLTREDAQGLLHDEQWDYQFQEKYSHWLQEKVGNNTTLAVLIGLRAEESFNRWRATHLFTGREVFENKKYFKKISDTIWNAYPLYDWKVEDVWHAHYILNHPYNKVYDDMFLAHIPLHNMRVASPFNGSAISSLYLYRLIDPGMWAKIESRVQGTHLSSLYGNTPLMGWKHIYKPAGMTWKQWCEYLLSTLPSEIAEKYFTTFTSIIDYWKTHGGELTKTAVNLLPSTIHNSTTIAATSDDTFLVKFNELPDELPDNTDLWSAPTYKRMVICILKNDFTGKNLNPTAILQEIGQRSRICGNLAHI